MFKKYLLALIFLGIANSSEMSIDADMRYMETQVIICMDSDLTRGYTLLGNIARYKIGSEQNAGAIRIFYDYMDANCPKQSEAILNILSKYNDVQRTMIGFFLIAHTMEAAGNMLLVEGSKIEQVGLDYGKRFKRNQ